VIWRELWSKESWWGRACFTVAGTGLVIFCFIVMMRTLVASDAQLHRIASQMQVWSVAVAGLGLSVRLVTKASRQPVVTQKMLQEARDELAKAVLRSESEQRTRLLGVGRPDTRRVNVRFHADLDLAEFEPRDGQKPGQLTAVLDYYQSIPSRRLVILGDPGSGKTVLAVELLVQLLERQGIKPAAVAADLAGLVPVRFGLSTWPTDSQSLEEWLSRQLAIRYQLRPALAASLVAERLILPILDGLDEMDPEDDHYARAKAVLRSLDDGYLQGSRRAPVVVTCRAARYSALQELPDTLGGLDQAQCAAIQPLTADQISAYLASRLRTGKERTAWDPVLRELARDPGGALSSMLDTPWRLTLAATVYSACGDPGTLLCVTGPDAPARLSELLLGRFIESATALYPRVTRSGRLHPRPYSPGQVTRWLEVLAGYLTAQATAGRSGIDLSPQELWRLAGRSARAAHIAYSAVVGLFLVFMSIGVLETCTLDPVAWARAIRAIVLGGQGEPYGFRLNGIEICIADPLLFCSVFWSGWDSCPPPHRLMTRAIRTTRGMLSFARRFTEWLGLGLATGLVEGLVAGYATNGQIGLDFGLDTGLTVCVVAGFAAALTSCLNAPSTAAATPYGPLHQDLAFGVICGIGLGLAGTAADWTIGWLTEIPSMPTETSPRFWLTTGLAYWLSVGLGFGLTLWSRARVRYILATGVFAVRGQLPLGLAEFLNWAYGAGLLRVSGTAFQFRHRELQDRLTFGPPDGPAEKADVTDAVQQWHSSQQRANEQMAMPDA
jgi:hypothetical protein